jgi:hypothetical protein
MCGGISKGGMIGPVVRQATKSCHRHQRHTLLLHCWQCHSSEPVNTLSSAGWGVRRAMDPAWQHHKKQCNNHSCTYSDLDVVHNSAKSVDSLCRSSITSSRSNTAAPSSVLSLKALPTYSSGDTSIYSIVITTRSCPRPTHHLTRVRQDVGTFKGPQVRPGWTRRTSLLTPSPCGWS